MGNRVSGMDDDELTTCSPPCPLLFCRVSRTWYIYGLLDRRNNDIFYVGSTFYPSNSYHSLADRSLQRADLTNELKKYELPALASVNVAPPACFSMDCRTKQGVDVGSARYSSFDQSSWVRSPRPVSNPYGCCLCSSFSCKPIQEAISTNACESSVMTCPRKRSR